MTVTKDQIAKASAAALKMVNVDILALACNEYNFPFFLALAIMEKETHGHNIYGHDVGGALTNFDHDCNSGNYQVFRWLVDSQGMKSNGVGPMQLTWKGFFTNPQGTGMEDLLMQPFRPRDNIFYAVGRVLTPSFTSNKKHTALTNEEVFHAVAKAYNGKASYADDAVAKAKAWFKIVGNADNPFKF